MLDIVLENRGMKFKFSNEINLHFSLCDANLNARCHTII